MINYAYRIHSEPHEVASRLQWLGLDEQTLVDAVTAAHEAAASTTPHHPISFPGTYAWSEAIKTLRDLLAPHQWEAENVEGQPLVVREDGRIAITSAGGNEATGRIGRRPKTRTRKGSVTKNAVRSNNLYLLPELELDEIARLEASKKRETWILLIFRDEKSQETRSELSRPVFTDDKGKISDWSDRIILPALPYGGSVSFGKRTPEDGNLSGDIKVEIKRRA